MDVIPKGLEKQGKFGEAGCRLGALRMLTCADIRHYNMRVNSISGLLRWRFERAAGSLDGRVPLRDRGRKVGR
jgi:hypothetical protein